MIHWIGWLITAPILFVVFYILLRKWQKSDHDARIAEKSSYDLLWYHWNYYGFPTIASALALAFFGAIILANAWWVLIVVIPISIVTVPIWLYNRRKAPSTPDGDKNESW